jgi:hypothetical protein
MGLEMVSPSAGVDVAYSHPAKEHHESGFVVAVEPAVLANPYTSVQVG